ncbi:MAG: DKNYY domain-containing protein, partial [Flavobacteriales bacterium]
EGTYSRDATDVFWKDDLVEEADAESFEALINEYGKDKNNVYLRGEVQSDLDPDTFQPECNYG